MYVMDTEALLYITITIAAGASCYDFVRRIMSNTQIESRPWEMPIWKPVRGKESVLLYLIAIHVLAVIGLILYPVPGIPVFVTALVFNLLGALGTTVCNHRYLAHRTLKLNKVV